MRLSKLTLPLFISLALIISSCQKKEQFSEIPHIEYKDFVQFTDSAQLTLTFTDGDGDLGLPDADSTHNCFVKYFEKQNGKFVEINFSPPFKFKIPMLTQAGKTKSLQGEIRLSISPFNYDFLSDFDTIRYEIYVIDRANHESNHVTTPEFITPD
jgi:hypothetical protein